jgi:hypothetical protein
MIAPCSVKTYGEFGILQDAVAAKDENGAGDLFGGNGLTHWRFVEAVVDTGEIGIQGWFVAV